MKIAVVGGGIFGLTIASVLGKEGFYVDLYEKEDDVFKAASGINQFRLHRGYHYPRSIETIKSCIKGEIKFREFYPEVIIDSPHEHYYAIAKEKSFMTANQCFKVWSECGIEYEEKTVESLNNSAIEKCVKVKESIIDPYKFKETCIENCRKYNVKIHLNSKVEYEDLEEYDLIISATYANSNYLLKKFPEYQKDFQFELVEKLVLKLPERFKNISVVIQDGPFCCIDPYGRTGFSLMGNVTHAIHHRNIGKSPEIPEEFKDLLNKGIIKNPKITKIKDFLDDAETFFPGIKDEAEHIGSMFTIRTVLPYREHDDARPTVVERINNKIITVFSGKIPTCVDAAEEILKIAKKKRDNTKKFNVGVIGIGKWGKQLIRVFNEFSNIKICANKKDFISQKFIKRKYPHIKTTFDYNEILDNKDIDIIIIATPIKTHFEIAKKALEKGKKVFLEKPLSENLEQAEELIKLSQGNILFIGHVFLYHPCYKFLKELLFEDSIQEIEFTWNKVGSFDEDLLLNLASQDIAIFNGLTKEFPKNPVVRSEQSLFSQIDATSIDLDFGINKKCRININRLHPQKKKEIKIITQKGRVYYWIDNRILELDKETKDFKILFESEKEPLKEEVKEFLEYIKKNQETILNKNISLNVMRILNNIKDSTLN